MRRHNCILNGCLNECIPCVTNLWQDKNKFITNCYYNYSYLLLVFLVSWQNGAEMMLAVKSLLLVQEERLSVHSLEFVAFLDKSDDISRDNFTFL